MAGNFFSNLFSPRPCRYLTELRSISASEPVQRSIQTHLMGLGVAIGTIDGVQRSIALAKKFSSATGVPVEDILQVAASGDLDDVIRRIESDGISGLAQWRQEMDDDGDPDDSEVTDVTDVYNQGVGYLNGQGGFPRDMAKAYRAFRLAAEKGHISAQHNLAVMYNTGTYVAKDQIVAAQWFARAADAGHANAAFNLAHLYLTGAGVTQNNQQAHIYLCVAADNGHAGALEYVHKFLASRGLDKNGNPQRQSGAR